MSDNSQIHKMKRIVRNETVDRKRLRYVLDNQDLLREHIPTPHEITKLEYMEKAMGDQEELEVTYEKDGPGRYKPSIRVGRRQEFAGLATLTREFRGYLSQDHYFDLDMVNCHPVILNVLTENEILKDYCQNRAEFMSLHGVKKQDLLACLYDHYPSTRYTGILSTLNQQLRNVLVPELKKEFPLIWKRSKNKGNQVGSFLSSVVQFFETLLLNACLEFAKQKEVQVDVLIHDGFQVRVTPDLDIEGFIRDLTEYIRIQDFKGRSFPMQFLVKPFDNKIALKLAEHSLL